VLALRHLGTARTGAYFALGPFVGALVAVIPDPADRLSKADRPPLCAVIAVALINRIPYYTPGCDVWLVRGSGAAPTVIRSPPRGLGGAMTAAVAVTRTELVVRDECLRPRRSAGFAPAASIRFRRLSDREGRKACDSGRLRTRGIPAGTRP
jgi:hypothetical protein